MKRRRFLVLLTVAVGLIAAGTVAASAGPREHLDLALKQIVADGATAALAELRDENGIWRGAQGVEQLGSPVTPSVHSRFRQASVTKTFVATVILQLAGEGRLALEDAVERWLPGMIPNGSRITLRHLLQHTSGLADYVPILIPSTEELLRNRYRTFQPAQLLAIGTSRPPLFEPGTSWSYSNTNCIALGMVIFQVTGRAYGDEVRQRLLEPLGLRATEVPGTTTTIDGPHAHGYIPVERDGEVYPVDITEVNPSAAWAAAEMISTTTDLNTFLAALLGGRLMTPALRHEMLTSAPPARFGFGLGIRRIDLPCGVTVFGHVGDFPGYLTYALSTEDGKRQLTLSVNPWGGYHTQPVNNLLATAFCTK